MTNELFSLPPVSFPWTLATYLQPTVDCPPSRRDTFRWPQPTWLAGHSPDPLEAHRPSPRETVGSCAIPALSPHPTSHSFSERIHQGRSQHESCSSAGGQPSHNPLCTPSSRHNAGAARRCPHVTSPWVKRWSQAPFRDLTMFSANYLSQGNTAAPPTRLKIYSSWNSLLQRILEFLAFSLYKW